MSRSGSGSQSPSVAEVVSSPVVTLRRSSVIGCLSLLAVLTSWAGASGWYLLRKDDLAARLITRETVRQYAYEDRIAGLRSEIDRLSSRALLDQDSVEARVSELTTRQSQLETRQAVVAALAENLQAAGITSSLARGRATGLSASPKDTYGKELFSRDNPVKDIPGLGFAPLNGTKPMPSPEPLPLRGIDRKQVNWQGMDEPETREQKIGGSMGVLAAALNDSHHNQIKVLAELEAAVSRETARYKAVGSAIHLDLEKLTSAGSTPSALGGPFIPMQINPKANEFEAAVYRLQPKLGQFTRLKKAVDALPLLRPMAAAVGDMTSNFGYRMDPFNRAPAMHSGIDFRAEHGSAIRATGGGKVITAEYTGGYGNMVEVDHGNDITTRYGHMSAILVNAGQTVQPGDILGRVGSTGRSTGPHLHYETRIGGEAVDPHRFIVAGQKFKQ